MRDNGSYPSGHSTIGFGLAPLIFAGMFPDRQDEFLAGGMDFGYSRVIRGVHWQSDVEAGRLSAAALVNALRDHPEFQEAVARSKAELEALAAKAGR